MQQTTQAVREALRTDGQITSLASLVRVAIEDGRQLDPEVYTPDYGSYHSPVTRGDRPTCNVCLAGAAIVGTLRVSPAVSTGPSDFKVDRSQPRTARALMALDSVRTGSYGSAYGRLEIALFDEYPNGLPYPRMSCFDGFDAFGAHLDDLELRVLPQLRDFEVKLFEAHRVEQERASVARQERIEALKAEQARIEAALSEITYEGDDEDSDDA